MGKLIASGESVGLPAGEVGNTEVGHLTMGAGRVIFQDLVRINTSIEDGSIHKNASLLAAVEHANTYDSGLHMMGLVGTGNVHSSMEHLKALLRFASAKQVTKLYLHLFTDGRDSKPDACLSVVKEIEQILSDMGRGEIASITGRYYAMDRDRRWDRTQATYENLTAGSGESGPSGSTIIEESYQKDITDEFIKPTCVVRDGAPIGLIQDNDAVVFFNFRVDRPIQLTAAFVLEKFEEFRSFEDGFAADGNLNPVKTPEFDATFERSKKVSNLFFVTMTEYMHNLPVSGMVIEPEEVQHSFPEVLSKHGKTHMHMAESEKERFVTYYFNGLNEGKREGEEWSMVASPKVATYDLKPEMSVYKLVNKFKKHVRECAYDFFVMNFANADMVSHTGNVPASIEAIEHVDKALGEVANIILKYGGWLFITADHGNAEELLDYSSTSYFYTSEQGEVNTAHSQYPVPFNIVSDRVHKSGIQIPDGSLADVAPTMLTAMGLPVPEEMTGKNLLDLSSLE